MSRYPAAEKCFKNLGDTRQPEVHVEFPENISKVLLRIADLSLQVLSDFKYYFGFIVEEIFELGHRSNMFRPCLDNIRANAIRSQPS